MNDWNGNGKYDMQDSYMDYHLANSNSSGPSSDWWIWPLLAMLIAACPLSIPFVILGIFIFGR